MNPEQDNSYEHDGGEPPRRSRRSNFGQIPDRYGNPVYFDRRTAQTAVSRPSVSGVFEESVLRRRHPDVSLNEVRDVPADEISVRTSSSRRSTRSMQKRLEAELKMAEELQARKREIHEREKARMALQAELDRKIDEEQFVEEQRVAGLRLALQQARIDEEDRLSQDLSDEDDDQLQESRRSGTFTVKAPEEYTMIQPPVPFGNSPSHQPPIPVEKLEEDFSHHDQVIVDEPEVQIGGSLGKKSVNRQVKIEEILQTMATTMDAIARVTIEKKDASTKSTSSKFLARQSTSKDLPHFYGDSDDWPNFIAEFERSTALCEFSNVENISRLQRCLKGKAKESVKSLLNVPDNVPEVISILTMCFGRPDQIIKSLIEKAVKAPPVREGRLESLVEFSNAVRNVVSTVEHLHCTEYLMNPQLIEELVHKLPTHLQLKWGSKLVKLGKPDLGKFSEWLKKQGMAASLVSYAGVSNSERDTEKRGRPSRVFNIADMQKQNYADSTGRSTCSCCQKMSHDLSKCFQFTKMSHDDRWKFARTSRLCFQCLRAGHRTPDCKGRTCGVSGCRKFHHYLLHKKEEEHITGEEAKEKIVMMCRSNAVKKTLLQILPVVVVGPKGEAATYCLLDPGAQDSFIEWDMASRVGLTGPKKPIQLVGPGISKPVYEKNSREVNCGLRPVNENQVLKFNTVSTVKELNLPKQTVDVSKLCEDWPYLQDVPVKSYFNVKPTILIGQDNCHLLTYDEKASCKSGGPIAIKTALGWTIQGRTTTGGASVEDRYVCHVRKEDCDLDSSHWVPTTEYVADDATRDKEECDFSPDSLWVNGPAVLNLKPEELPKEKFNVVQEPKAEPKKLNVVWKTLSAESLLDVTRFSTWLKLIRSISWLVRFIMKIDNRAPTNTDGWESWRAPVIQCLGGTVLRRSPRRIVQLSNQNCEELSPGEFMYAEKLWIRQSQWDSFPEEMTALSSSKQIDKSSKLLNLAPYLDNGIMKIRGRLDKSKSVSEDTRRPVVLDPNHPYTVLLVKYYHLEAKHVGQETVVNELRQKYWIFNARAAVKSSLNACNICKINRAKPVVPEMGGLPEFRLNIEQRPFTYTGLDNFGPMEVTIGKMHEKRYGALFTCLSTRAIHLELASSLDTDSVIMAITRFIARRGVPSRIYSDTGTNFHGADNELKKCIAAIDSKSVRQKFGHQGLDWIFNPPSAPHMGGVWERLVQSVKVAWKNMLKTKYPKEEVLHTALLECERIVNSRPITHVPADPDDPEGLTPNHFLLGSSNGQPPPGDFSEDLCPKQRWKHCQVLADHFWKRWVREYLPTLSRRTKWTTAKPINVGDLVFIADGDLPRCQWPRGRIVKVFPGSDGNVRVADVKTITGVYRRPVVKLCVLDVNPDLVDASRDTSTGGSMLPSRTK